MELLASGREADVFDIGDNRVLRRSRDDRGVEREAEVMIRLAAQGFPVPAVHHAAGRDLVMERVEGPSMLTALLTEDLDVTTAAEIMTTLHTRLRQADILHLDLHPDNVILSPNGPVLIDWSNCTEGPPGLDPAISALILAQVSVGGTDLADLAHDLLRVFAPRLDITTELPAAVRLRETNPSMSAQELADLGKAADLVRRLSGR
ncbi:phosphotransferase [Kutzneria buriramensis]|uniref:phosphotransferase n=1 Tax=Kutzneria buriramensis TaxID=1045776 RepID=UPI001B87E965|nr:phosphotransferase [Kutzneria buriramensis]